MGGQLIPSLIGLLKVQIRIQVEDIRLGADLLEHIHQYHVLRTKAACQGDVGEGVYRPLHELLRSFILKFLSGLGN
ncbi:hypothetical protein D3C81_1928130 [compost metagenome]